MGTCTTPILLTPTRAIDGGSVTTVVVTGTGAAPISTCADGGLETVFRLEVTQVRNLTVVASSLDGGQVNTSLALRESPCAAGPELSCLERPAVTGTTFFRLPSLAIGTYFVFAAVPPGESVKLDLVSSTPLPPAPNDTCATAEALVFSNNLATTSGRNVGATNGNLPGETTPTCSIFARTRPDVVYSYTLTAPQDVTIKLDGVDAFTPVIYVRKACADSSPAAEVFCDTLRYNTGPTLLNQQPGTYWLWVDGSAYGGGVTPGVDGFFDLSVTLLAPTPPPSNDLCVAPLPLFPDGGTSSLHDASTYGAFINSKSPCGLEVDRDLYYSFSLSSPRQLTAYARDRMTDGGVVRPTLMVLEANRCQADAGLSGIDGGQKSVLGCNAGYPPEDDVTLVVSELPAGDYLLVAAGSRRTYGEFELEAHLDPVAPVATNLSCASPLELAFDPSGRAVVTGNTRDAGDDHQGQLCSATASGPGSADVVYSLTTPAAAGGDGGVTLYAQLRTTNRAELGPSVFLRTDCASDAGAQLACAAELRLFHNGVVDLQAEGLRPGSQYFLWVDSSKTDWSAGPFSLRVDLAVAPPNETCGSATFLPLNTSVVGTTLGAANDYSAANLYAPPCESDALGPDVVYRFTTTTAGTYTIRAEPELPSFMAFKVFRGACVAAADCAGESFFFFSPSTQELSILAPAATDYFVIIETPSTTAGVNGRFLLGVTH